MLRVFFLPFCFKPEEDLLVAQKGTQWTHIKRVTVAILSSRAHPVLGTQTTFHQTRVIALFPLVVTSNVLVEQKAANYKGKRKFLIATQETG